MSRAYQHSRFLGEAAVPLRAWLGLILILALLAGCRPAGAGAGKSNQLIVYAAASLTDAFQAASAGFDQSNAEPTLAFNFGASSQLAIQLLDGAPADVFASANERQVRRVQEAGLLLGPPVAFATNRLVLIVPADNPADIHQLDDLGDPGVRIVTAVPGVPVRAYTDALFEHLATTPAGAELGRAYRANVVSEEDNVRQAAAKVALGEADAAIVYASDARSDLASRLMTIQIPQAETIRPRYFVGVLKTSAHPESARAFIDFLLSEAGQRALQSQGFSPLVSDG